MQEYTSSPGQASLKEILLMMTARGWLILKDEVSDQSYSVSDRLLLLTIDCLDILNLEELFRDYSVQDIQPEKNNDEKPGTFRLPV